jgi:hypothetical protein
MLRGLRQLRRTCRRRGLSRKLGIIIAVLPLAMCGGKSDTSSADPQEPVENLSLDQLKSLCDWEAGLFGGYGQSLACDGEAGGDPGFSHLYIGPSDQASCAANLSNQYRMCPTTLDEAKLCLQLSVTTFCGSTTPEPTACVTFFSSQCQ